MRSRPHLFIAAVALALAATACGSDDTVVDDAPDDDSEVDADAPLESDAADTATDDAASPAGGSVAEDLSNLCDMLPAAEVEAALGEPVETELVSVIEGAANCNYGRAAGGQVRISYARFDGELDGDAAQSVTVNREGFEAAGFDVRDSDLGNGYRYVDDSPEPNAGISVLLDDATVVGIDIQNGIDPAVMDPLFEIYLSNVAN